jgi:hypothetical protein
MSYLQSIINKKSLTISLPLISLIILTLVLAIFPMNLTLDTYPYESVFGDRLIPYLFLLSIWTISFILCWRNTRTNGLALLLAICFVLVYIMPLVINSPYLSNESLYQAAHAEQITDTGFVTTATQLVYSDFPSVHILGSVVSQLFGVSIIDAAKILIILNILMITVVTFQLFRIFNNRTITNKYLVLGVLLAFEGNIMLPQIVTMFHASALGLFFYLLFLMLLISSNSNPRLFPLCGLVLIAVITTHFVTSLLCVLTLVGAFVLMNAFRQRESLKRTGQLALLSVVVFGVWTMWYTLSGANRILSAFYGYHLRFEYISALLNANLGSGEFVPSWVSGARFFWLLFISIVGGIIVLSAFFSSKRKSMAIELGGFISLILVTVFLTIFSPGNGEIYRYVLYGSFFSVPFIVGLFLRNSKGRTGLIVLATISLLFIFPTFLAQNTTVIGSAIHPSEVAAGSYISLSFNRTSNMITFFGDRNVEILYPYFFPYSSFVLLPPAYAEGMSTLSGIANATQSLYQSFERHRQVAGNSFFIFSFKSTYYYQHLSQLKSEDNIWISLQA